MSVIPKTQRPLAELQSVIPKFSQNLRLAGVAIHAVKLNPSAELDSVKQYIRGMPPLRVAFRLSKPVGWSFYSDGHAYKDSDIDENGFLKSSVVDSDGFRKIYETPVATDPKQELSKS